MAASFLTSVFLPLALFMVMLGMGLGLKLEDFTRVLLYPKAAIIGLLAQLVMLPLLGFILAGIFPLNPGQAVGVIILAACPGGATSNLLTYLAQGNVALSITLTAMSSLITIFSIPLVINLATQRFLGTATALQLPFVPTVLQIALITLIPVALGMVLHYFRPQFAALIERGVKWLSLALLGLIIAGLLVQQRDQVVGFFLEVGLVTLVLNVLAMGLGYLIAVAGRLDQPSSKAITVEVGIQNGTLAIAIASAPTLLNQPDFAIPAAIYSLIMFMTGGAFAVWSVRK
ncbi:bile acid:sodium symporter family protein [Thermosynechococcaceae cyanobacterium BACA0444]|uniref:Bile acid:sodium symporter family protein n=1 Tax=Pseudocalidococcus azoricus BACA0444 TaxID=2918990 RepID=A0AAE4JVN4_9CYAN|nr:bile acid:sodium symporter family protein [Pseudocalidococcus azoricus]MDS3860246.1 bile acid:sodium symporter family protein [Pseudocalidococcus azoricus BACA0444]